MGSGHWRPALQVAMRASSSCARFFETTRGAQSMGQQALTPGATRVKPQSASVWQGPPSSSAGSDCARSRPPGPSRTGSTGAGATRGPSAGLSAGFSVKGLSPAPPRAAEDPPAAPGEPASAEDAAEAAGAVEADGPDDAEGPAGAWPPAIGEDTADAVAPPPAPWTAGASSRAASLPEVHERRAAARQRARVRIPETMQPGKRPVKTASPAACRGSASSPAPACRRGARP